MAPEIECERDHEESCCEQSPRYLTRRAIGAGLQVPDVLGIFARGIFVRRDFCRNRWGITRSLQVVGYSLILVEANETRISADKAFVEDASRQLVELVFFQRLQHAGADLGGDGNLLEGDLALLALLFQFFAKGRQTSLSLSLDCERNLTLLRSKIIGHSSGSRQQAEGVVNARSKDLVLLGMTKIFEMTKI